MLEDQDTTDPYNINIYPWGDYEEDDDGMCDGNLWQVEEQTVIEVEED